MMLNEVNMFPYKCLSEDTKGIVYRILFACSHFLPQVYMLEEIRDI